MSIAERARELSNEFCRWAATETPMDDLAAEHLALKFEQALLAERRLAMEEAAKLVDEWAFALHESEDYDLAKAVAQGAQKLRAAAEKEVGK